MMDFINQAKKFLWAFVELLFASILAVMLVYLIMNRVK
jgi:hypothetical protein